MMSLDDEAHFVRLLQNNELRAAKVAAKNGDIEAADKLLKEVISKISSPEHGRWNRNSDAMGAILVDLFSVRRTILLQFLC